MAVLLCDVNAQSGYQFASTYGKPFRAPSFFFLDLGNTQRNIARFPQLRVETCHWQELAPECCMCDPEGMQSEKHAIFLCSSNSMYSLKRKFARPISGFLAHRAWSEDVIHSFPKPRS